MAKSASAIKLASSNISHKLHRVKACGFFVDAISWIIGQPVDFCAYMAQYQISLIALFLSPMANPPVR